MKRPGLDARKSRTAWVALPDCRMPGGRGLKCCRGLVGVVGLVSWFSAKLPNGVLVSSVIAGDIGSGDIETPCFIQ